MATKQVPLNKLLAAIDNKDRGFYDRLDEQEKKAFSGYIGMRWAATVSAPNPDVDGYYLRSTNQNANIKMFDLSKHPKLQWLMLTTISPGIGLQNHNFIKHKPKPKNTTAVVKKQLVELYPNMKDDDLDVLSKLVTKKELKAYIKDHGE